MVFLFFDLFKSIPLFQLPPLFYSNFISVFLFLWSLEATMYSVCVVELLDTVTYRKILGVAQHCL